MDLVEEESLPEDISNGSVPPPPPPPPAPSAPASPPPVQMRTNLQETAFWLPELTAGQDGSIDIDFYQSRSPHGLEVPPSSPTTRS